MFKTFSVNTLHLLSLFLSLSFLTLFLSHSRFRSKYHPDESGKRKAEAHAALQNRLGSFQYLMENSWFENISMDIDRAPQILKILDAGERRLLTLENRFTSPHVCIRP